MKCKYCSDTVEGSTHYCSKTERHHDTSTEDFLISAVVGYATDSALLGSLLGGDITGAILGDLLNGGDLFD